MHETDENNHLQDLKDLLNNFQESQRRIHKYKNAWKKAIKDQYNGLPVSSNNLNRLKDLEQFDYERSDILLIELEEYIPYFVIPQLIDDVNESSNIRISFPK